MPAKQKPSVSYGSNLEPNLSYPLTTLVGEYSQIVNATWEASGLTLKSGSVSKKTFKLKAEDFVNGELVRVRFRDDASYKKTLTLKNEPIGPVRFESSIKRCTDRNTLGVKGQDVTVACAFGEKATHKVRYDQKDPTFQDFTLAGIANPENGKWSVYANGVEVSDYTRTGSTVSIRTPLKDGAVVVLVFMPQ